MNALPPLDTRAPLPAAITDLLNTLIRRSRRLILIRGLAASCAAGAGAFLVIMLLDASLTLLMAWPRWVLSLLAYGAWAGATVWFLVRPLARSFTLTGIARLIEAHHPELQERISSAVELLGSRDLPSIRGSDVLIGALAEEAVREAVSLKPRQEISFASAIPYVVLAGGVAVLLGALFIAWPQQARFLIARAAAPFLNLPNVHAFDLRLEPGDTLVPSGASLRIVLRTANPAVASAEVRRKDHHGRETAIPMALLPSPTNQATRCFAVTLPGITSEFHYRVHAGDAVSRYYSVRVAIPPVIRHLDIVCRPPAYTGLAEKRERDGTGTIRALAGTEVTVSAQVNKAAQSALLAVITSSSTNTFTGVKRENGEELFYDFSLILPDKLNGEWTLRLADEIGLVNTPFRHVVQSLPDNPPGVAVSSPVPRTLRLNRDTSLPVAYHAEDDFGLSGVALMLSLPGSTNEIIRPLPLPGEREDSAPRACRGETTLALGDPLFATARQVLFRIRVTDNLPASLGGPHKADSGLYTIVLDAGAASWKEQVLASQEQRLQEGIRQVQQHLASARERAQALDNPLAQEATLKEATSSKIDALQDILAAADNTLRGVAADIDKGFFEGVATNLASIAEQHVSKAENLAGQIRLMDTPAERTAMNSNVTAEVAASVNALTQALKESEQARAEVRRAVALDQLAAKQADLAKACRQLEGSPASTNAGTASAESQWKQAESRIADEVSKMIRESPETAAQAAAAVSNLSVQAAGEAKQLQARQTELAALTKDEVERRQKFDRQWSELAARQDKLAELARNEPGAAPQSEAMRDASKALESGEKQQAIDTQRKIAEALKEAAGKLAASPAKQNSVKPDGQEKKSTVKPDAPGDLVARVEALKSQLPETGKKAVPQASLKEDAQQSAQQAQEAGKLAQEAAQAAAQSAEKARQMAQQAEQQAVAARKATPSSSGAAEEEARQAKQTEQTAEQHSQEAKREAQAAAQSVEKARQMEQQVQRADAAISARAGQRAREEAAKAAGEAVAKAVKAAEAAHMAAAAVTESQARREAAGVAALARQQDTLRKESAGLLALQQAESEAFRAKVAEHVAGQQKPEEKTEVQAIDRPLEALGEEQARLGREIGELARKASLLQSQAQDAGVKSEGTIQAAMSVKGLTEAAQSANQAAKQLRTLSDKQEESGQPREARKLQQAADQAVQDQARAVQTLQQAARTLEQAAAASAPAQTVPVQTAQPRVTPVSPELQQALMEGGQSARQAAENHNAEDAARSAARLEQAAEEAAKAAQSRGGNARPQTLQTASAEGKGSQDTPPASEGIPVSALRLGLKLQDWLRLHGELGGEALQAVNAEGPEEYRPIIQRYFREVSGHGDKE